MVLGWGEPGRRGGREARAWEETIDGACIALNPRDDREIGGADGYDLPTASQGEDESLDDAVELARMLGEHTDAPVCIVMI